MIQIGTRRKRTMYRHTRLDISGVFVLDTNGFSTVSIVQIYDPPPVSFCAAVPDTEDEGSLDDINRLEH